MESSHKKRIITGLILAAVLLGCLAYGGRPLQALIVAAALWGLWEFYAMFWPGRTGLVRKILGLAAGLALMCSVCLGQALVGQAAFGLAFLVCALGFLVDYGRGNAEARPEQHAVLLFGLLYVPFILALALDLPKAQVLFLVVAAYASDTGAYYAGVTLGRHKIWPRVSPKKSWEGAVGGLLACVAATVGLSFILAHDAPLDKLNWPAWALIGVLFGVSAQLGDFFESAVKRALRVKDSSNLLPGHGGLLDRIDSLLFVLLAFKLLLLGLALWNGALEASAAAPSQAL